MLSFAILPFVILLLFHKKYPDMIDAILKVTAVAVLMLVGWIAYERILWPEDYMKYEAPYLLFGEVDTTYKQHVNPALF